jgi:signal transduction histidine kinase
MWTDCEDEQQFTECSQLVGQAMAEVRTLSYLLYPPLLDDVGLPSAASEYIEGFAKRSGMQTTFETSPDFGRIRRVHNDLPAALGVGLRGMRERIAQLGGTLHVGSNGRGTTVKATLPCGEERSAAAVASA